jgi:hypothetical protein
LIIKTVGLDEKEEIRLGGNLLCCVASKLRSGFAHSSAIRGKFTSILRPQDIPQDVVTFNNVRGFIEVSLEVSMTISEEN